MRYAEVDRALRRLGFVISRPSSRSKTTPPEGPVLTEHRLAEVSVDGQQRCTCLERGGEDIGVSDPGMAVANPGDGVSVGSKLFNHRTRDAFVRDKVHVAEANWPGGSAPTVFAA